MKLQPVSEVAQHAAYFGAGIALDCPLTGIFRGDADGQLMARTLTFALG